MKWEFIENGSVTSPHGFQAAGVSAAIKAGGTPDIALIYSERSATAAGAFTANRFPAAPVVHGRKLLANGAPVQAVFINSGNANACTGGQGLRDTEVTADYLAELLSVPTDAVLVSSTGRIGVPLPMDKIRHGADAVVRLLSPEGGPSAAAAIMTTDTRPKSVAVRLNIGGTPVVIGGMAKGAGMIAPKLRPAHDQATMLAYVTTDAAMELSFLQDCLAQSLDQSFNRITVDGDMSTNDTFIAVANGAAENERLTAEHPDAAAFVAAFSAVASRLAREIVLDGEGVTRFVELRITGAKDDDDARRCAETIANSALCKTAWYGADPNWGRLLAAAGRAEVDVNPEAVSIDFAGIPAVREGRDAGTPEKKLALAIDCPEFTIDMDLGVGNGTFTIWTCDFSYEYVKINADYHT